MDKKIILATLLLGMFVSSCECIRQARANYKKPQWMLEIEAYNADPKHKIKYICKKRKPIGSNIPRWYCQTTCQRRNRAFVDQRMMWH